MVIIETWSIKLKRLSKTYLLFTKTLGIYRGSKEKRPATCSSLPWWFETRQYRNLLLRTVNFYSAWFFIQFKDILIKNNDLKTLDVKKCHFITGILLFKGIHHAYAIFRSENDQMTKFQLLLAKNVFTVRKQSAIRCFHLHHVVLLLINVTVNILLNQFFGFCRVIVAEKACSVI